MEKIKKVDLREVLVVLLIGLIGYILGTINTLIIAHNIIKKMLSFW